MNDADAGVGGRNLEVSGAPRGAPDGITPGFTRDTRLKMAAVGRGLLEVWS